MSMLVEIGNGDGKQIKAQASDENGMVQIMLMGPTVGPHETEVMCIDLPAHMAADFGAALIQMESHAAKRHRPNCIEAAGPAGPGLRRG